MQAHPNRKNCDPCVLAAKNAAHERKLEARRVARLKKEARKSVSRKKVRDRKENLAARKRREREKAKKLVAADPVPAA